MPGLRRAFRQHRLDILERDAARLEHDEEMIKQVGRFRRDLLAAFADRGEPGFDRFLAELLGAMGDAFVEQRARLGGLGARLGARRHALFEVTQGELGAGLGRSFGHQAQ